MAADLTGRKLQSRCQQLLNLLFRIEIGPRALRPKRQQTIGGNLRARIGSMPVAGKYANITEALRPITGLMILGLHSPFQRQFRRDVGRCFLLQEACKLPKIIGHISQLESQVAAQSDVLLDSFSERFHRLPPGQGSAMERSETK